MELCSTFGLTVSNYFRALAQTDAQQLLLPLKEQRAPALISFDMFLAHAPPRFKELARNEEMRVPHYRTNISILREYFDQRDPGMRRVATLLLLEYCSGGGAAEAQRRERTAKLESKIRLQIRKMFDAMDGDGDGVITRAEQEAYFETKGADLMDAKIKAQMAEAWAKVDVNHDGRITFVEFEGLQLPLMMRRVLEKREERQAKTSDEGGTAGEMDGRTDDGRYTSGADRVGVVGGMYRLQEDLARAYGERPELVGCAGEDAEAGGEGEAALLPWAPSMGGQTDVPQLVPEEVMMRSVGIGDDGYFEDEDGSKGEGKEELEIEEARLQRVQKRIQRHHRLQWARQPICACSKLWGVSRFALGRSAEPESGEDVYGDKEGGYFYRMEVFEDGGVDEAKDPKEGAEGEALWLVVHSASDSTKKRLRVDERLWMQDEEKGGVKVVGASDGVRQGERQGETKVGGPKYVVESSSGQQWGYRSTLHADEAAPARRRQLYQGKQCAWRYGRLQAMDEATKYHLGIAICQAAELISMSTGEQKAEPDTNAARNSASGARLSLIETSTAKRTAVAAYTSKEHSKEHREEQYKKHLTRFQWADRDGDGVISAEEHLALLERTNAGAKMAAGVREEDETEEEFQRRQKQLAEARRYMEKQYEGLVIEGPDADTDGRITLEEYVAAAGLADLHHENMGTEASSANQGAAQTGTELLRLELAREVLISILEQRQRAMEKGATNITAVTTAVAVPDLSAAEQDGSNKYASVRIVVGGGEHDIDSFAGGDAGSQSSKEANKVEVVVVPPVAVQPQRPRLVRTLRPTGRLLLRRRQIEMGQESLVRMSGSFGFYSRLTFIEEDADASAAPSVRLYASLLRLRAHRQGGTWTSLLTARQLEAAGLNSSGGEASSESRVELCECLARAVELVQLPSDTIGYWFHLRAQRGEKCLAGIPTDTNGATGSPKHGVTERGSDLDARIAARIQEASAISPSQTRSDVTAASFSSMPSLGVLWSGWWDTEDFEENNDAIFAWQNRQAVLRSMFGRSPGQKSTAGMSPDKGVGYTHQKQEYELAVAATAAATPSAAGTGQLVVHMCCIDFGDGCADDASSSSRTAFYNSGLEHTKGTYLLHGRTVHGFLFYRKPHTNLYVLPHKFAVNPETGALERWDEMHADDDEAQSMVMWTVCELGEDGYDPARHHHPVDQDFDGPSFTARSDFLTCHDTQHDRHDDTQHDLDGVSPTAAKLSIRAKQPKKRQERRQGRGKHGWELQKLSTPPKEGWRFSTPAADHWHAGTQRWFSGGFMPTPPSFKLQTRRLLLFPSLVTPEEATKAEEEATKGEAAATAAAAAFTLEEASTDIQRLAESQDSEPAIAVARPYETVAGIITAVVPAKANLAVAVGGKKKKKPGPGAHLMLAKTSSSPSPSSPSPSSHALPKKKKKKKKKKAGPGAHLMAARSSSSPSPSSPSPSSPSPSSPSPSPSSPPKQKQRRPDPGANLIIAPLSVSAPLPASARLQGPIMMGGLDVAPPAAGPPMALGGSLMSMSISTGHSSTDGILDEIPHLDQEHKQPAVAVHLLTVEFPGVEGKPGLVIEQDVWGRLQEKVPVQLSRRTQKSKPTFNRKASLNLMESFETTQKKKTELALEFHIAHGAGGQEYLRVECSQPSALDGNDWGGARQGDDGGGARQGDGGGGARQGDDGASGSQVARSTEAVGARNESEGSLTPEMVPREQQVAVAVEDAREEAKRVVNGESARQHQQLSRSLPNLFATQERMQQRMVKAQRMAALLSPMELGLLPGESLSSLSAAKRAGVCRDAATRLRVVKLPPMAKLPHSYSEQPVIMQHGDKMIMPEEWKAEGEFMLMVEDEHATAAAVLLQSAFRLRQYRKSRKGEDDAAGVLQRYARARRDRNIEQRMRTKDQINFEATSAALTLQQQLLQQGGEAQDDRALDSHGEVRSSTNARDSHVTQQTNLLQ
jgi:Ca2+-binding EF-hand superfamily protein